MDPIAAAFLGAGLALLIAFGIFLIATGARPLTRKKEVIVVLQSGETLRGVLLHRWPSHLELGAAQLLSKEGGTKIDGTVELDRRNVVWVQVT